jgi:hypothetical protein
VTDSSHEGGEDGGRPTPPALVTSCVLGAVGGVALVAGLVTGSDALLGVAFAGGSLSLGAALVWRGQLIEDWHRRRG